jgi:hypothetical protein
VANVKLVIIYPRPKNVDAFENIYQSEHVPLAVAKLGGKTKMVNLAKGMCRKPSPNGRPRVAQEGNPGLLLMLLFLGTFDVHRRDWRALLRRMRLLRLGVKRQKMRVLRTK